MLWSRVLDYLDLSRDKKWRKTFFYFSLASLLLHIIAAWRSLGFYYCDEYYQILEFVSNRLGRTDSQHMPWEFQERIRPWFQPYLFFALVKIFSISNPFRAYFVFRLFSALLGWFSMTFFSVLLVRWVSKERLRVLILAALQLCYFFLYLNARVSSENFAGSFALLGLTLLVLSPFRVLAVVFAGFLLGCSFECRFQMGFLIVGVFLWLLFAEGLFLQNLRLLRRARTAIYLMSGICLAVLIGFLLDSMAYGSWVLTPWRYFYVNIFLHKATQWGTSPWWQYFVDIFSDLPVPFNLIWLAGFVGWFYFPRHILTWCTVVFVVAHCFVGHKELRFLYPIFAMLVPLALLTLDELFFRKFAGGSKLVKISLSVTAILNGVYIISRSFRAPTRYLTLLEELYNRNPNNLRLVTLNENPYRWCGLDTIFLAPQKVEVTQVTDANIEALNEILDLQGKTVVFLERRGFPDQKNALLSRCKLIKSDSPYASLPGWFGEGFAVFFRHHSYHEIRECE